MKHRCPICHKIVKTSSKEKTEEVLEIIAHHHSGGIDSDNFKIIWDADWLVNFKEDPAFKNITIIKILKTKTGLKFVS